MNFSCSQCNFTAQFESALNMHRQLHHETADNLYQYMESAKSQEMVPTSRSSLANSPVLMRKNKGFNLPARSTSATRLFGKIKAKICKSKTLFVHPEESQECMRIHDLSVPSECTSKALKSDSPASRNSTMTACAIDSCKETFGCHLCPFEADRITVLDRHLLNHHKIGLENLLKLVMAKTKDGLSDDSVQSSLGIRQPYYKQQDEIIEEGEFIIETVVPKVKILKHTATNTELNLIKQKDYIDDKNDIDLEDNWKMLSSEIENMMMNTMDIPDDDVMTKMKTLNDCMCKIVDSSNMLKKVLDSKPGKDLNAETSLNLAVGDRETPRNWGRAHSEKMDRVRNKYSDMNSRVDKGKVSSESFYF